jgi:hypothetical protein
MKMKNKIGFAILMLIVLSGVVYAAETVGTAEVTVCCEKTQSGLHCQDVLEEECASDSEFALPTACESTGPCDPGYCYDEEEGTCLDNVPKMVCNDEGGIWSGEKPAACGLGCCILGDQASFVTLVRCKRLSAYYGLEINYNPDIQNEAQCILAARSDERGACVFEEDFETTCEMTTRSQCTPDIVSGTTEQSDVEFENLPEEEQNPEEETAEETDEGDEQTEGEQNPEGETLNGALQGSPPDGCTVINDEIKFCPGMLCSAPELDTNCGKSEETTCIDGKEEVYFVDSCGNPANIYDASKIRDDNYWTYLVDKSEACNPGEANINSQTCGNCNYMRGSFCAATSSETTNPTYGTNICIDLNCPASEMTGGKARLHGESWCGFDTNRDFTFQETTQSFVTELLDGALRDVRANRPINANFRGGNVPVGSKFYRYLCSHGDVIVEPCADFRQEECIENEVAGYTEAACRVNRWQDCTSIFNRLDCENTDQRDCIWMDGIEYVLIGGLGNGSALDKSSLQAARGELKKIKTGERELGACVPKIPPGLKFWGTEEGDNAEAAGICSQANAICPVTYEKGLIGGDWECVENCECLDEGEQLKRVQLCMALGDCGPKVNIVGQFGRSEGYKIFEEELERD